MQKTKELPVPEEVRVLIQEYASDRLEAHPAACLIYMLKFLLTHDNAKLKVILSDFKHGEYFILLRDGGWDYVRSYTMAYFRH